MYKDVVRFLNVQNCSVIIAKVNAFSACIIAVVYDCLDQPGATAVQGALPEGKKLFTLAFNLRCSLVLLKFQVSPASLQAHWGFDLVPAHVTAFHTFPYHLFTLMHMVKIPDFYHPMYKYNIYANLNFQLISGKNITFGLVSYRLLKYQRFVLFNQ